MSRHHGALCPIIDINCIRMGRLRVLPEFSTPRVACQCSAPLSVVVFNRGEGAEVRDMGFLVIDAVATRVRHILLIVGLNVQMAAPPLECSRYRRMGGT